MPSGWTYKSTPSPGDIAVWAANKGIAREWGHVALVESVGNGTFNYVDVNGANGTSGSGTLANSNPSSFIHPDFASQPPYTQKPSNVSISLEKTSFFSNEHVTYYCSAKDVHYYVISIYNSDGSINETVRVNPGEYCTRYYNPGTYTAYCEAFNNCGNTFSNTVKFTVTTPQKPSNVKIALEKTSFFTEDHVTYYCSADNASYYVISIYNPDGSVNETVKVNPGEYCTRYYNPGKYTVYCEAFNTQGNAFSNTIEFYVRDHNPFGTVDSVQDNGDGSIRVKGWVYDADDMSKNLDVHVYVGGKWDTSGSELHVIKANAKRADVNSAYKCGDYHGFDAVIQTNKTGSQAVYIYGINIGSGNENTNLGHKTVNITKHTHSLTKVAAKAATTSAEGNIEYWTCSGCGKFFSDSAGKNKITKAQTVIPKITKSTTSEQKTTMSILTVNAKITKPKAAKKTVIVKWKKISKKNQKKISGLQIQVATDPDFTNIVKATTAGKKKTSKKISKLAKKTTYYVRVRTYKGSEIGKWSGPKKVKTK